MPAGNYNKTNTPLSALSSMTQNSTTTAIQSGPYTKAQCKRNPIIFFLYLLYNIFFIL